MRTWHLIAAGAVLVSFGVGWVFWPAGVVVAGLFCIGGGLLSEDDG